MDLSNVKSPEYQLYFDYCGATVVVSGNFESFKRVIGSGRVKVISAPVDSFLACFIKGAPVYLKGDMVLDAFFETEGDSVKSLRKNVSLKVIGNIRDGAVLKLSNIDKKFKWILDILEMVSIKKSTLHDALEFQKANFYLQGNLNKLILRRFVLRSPQTKINAVAYGELYLSPKFAKCIKGTLEFAGISKDFEVCDRKIN